MLASSRIRRCSGHGDFKTATRALLVLLETATPYAVSPVIMRKASKGVARMLQYYNDITTELTLDMNGVACLIASMPTVFLSAALNACGRQVSIGTDKVSPQFHQLYTDMFIRTCNERTQEHCHLVGLVSLFIATRSQSQMLAVIDALSQDGLGNLFRLLAELPAKIPIPCIDVFIHVANECVATAHLPAGVEDLFIRSAIAILLDNETAGATVASISKTMLCVAIAEPAYAQAMAKALEPHMAVAPMQKVCHGYYSRRIMASIEAGMWLHIDCVNPIGIKFEHDGIVSAPPERYSSAADIKVIHYAGSETHGKRLISETTLAEFLVVGSSARVVNARCRFSPLEVVKRARSQLGRADYNVLGMNCQHFGSWCYEGAAFSREVFKYGVVGTSFGLVVNSRMASSSRSGHANPPQMALLVHKIAVSPQSVAMERINGNGNISTWKDEEDTDEDKDIFSFAVVVDEPPPMTSGFPKRGE
eukprot:gene8669-biopygen15572